MCYRSHLQHEKSRSTWLQRYYTLHALENAIFILFFLAILEGGGKLDYAFQVDASIAYIE